MGAGREIGGTLLLRVLGLCWSVLTRVGTEPCFPLFPSRCCWCISLFLLELPLVQALDLQAAAADLLHAPVDGVLDRHLPSPKQEGRGGPDSRKNDRDNPSLLRGGRSSNNIHSSRLEYDENDGTGTSSRAASAVDAARSPSEAFSENLSNQKNTTTTVTARFFLPLVAAAGTVHVTLYVGQPPQPQVLIVDTGSHLTAWSCSSRPSPYAAAPPYQPHRSSTHQIVPCDSCRMGHPSLRCDSSSSTSAHDYGSLSLTDAIASTETEEKDEENGHSQVGDTCHVVQKYTEGSSWTAYEASELVTVAATAAATNTDDNRGGVVAGAITRGGQYDEDAVEWTVPFAFGCQTSATGLFKQQYANGILGMEQSAHSLLGVWQNHGLVDQHAFSLCTAPDDPDDGGGGYGVGGIMGVGGPVVHRHLAPMRYTPLIRRAGSSGGLYSVRVTRVWLGDTLLVSHATTPELVEAFARGKGALLDSGTTDTFFPRELAPTWAAAWKRLVQRPYSNLAQQYTHDEFLRFPNVTLDFDGGHLSWTIPPLHYIEGATSVRWRGRRELTNRLYVDEAEGAVLGLNAHRGHDVLYNADAGHVGVAPAACD